MSEIQVKRVVFQTEVIRKIREMKGTEGLGEFLEAMLKAVIKEINEVPDEWIITSKPEFDKLTNALGNVKEVNKSVGG